MDELRERLAEIADLDRVSMLMAWDQEVCMPPARRRGARRDARDGRPPGPRALHRRARRRAAGRGGAARRARGRHRARRAARLRQGRARPRRARGRDGPRRRGRARRVDAGTRGQRLRALRALPGAQHRAAPALQRVLPRGRAPLRPAARRLRAGHDHGRGARRAASACATASSRSWPRRPTSTTPCCAWAPSPRPASARCWAPCCARSASTSSSGASTRRPTRSRRRSP